MPPFRFVPSPTFSDSSSITCGYLSGAVVIGLLAQLVLGAWWVDGVTSLAIVYFLVKEGHEAWQSEHCCEDEARDYSCSRSSR
jgi:hypothetical protein